MNFFEAQDSARRSTSLLILMFVLAVAGLLVLSNILVFEFIYFTQYSMLAFSLAELRLVFDSNLSAMICASILGFITLGSLYKLVQLSSGGSAIAQHLGGVIVPRSSSDPLHKIILNIVEEMAIASGTPVPQVYILNEPGINAFAAGWKTTNAVIGITQGALERLNRDELQGVIAHEFSHIFNGDMRLNIRLIAVLHGILMIGMLGRMTLRSLRYVRTSRNSKGGGQAVLVILGIGGALAVVGYTGTFFGNWIKSLISKQREYLADASAVQFTRSDEGIANALKKIGGAIPGSAILAASVDEYSHAYFALGDNTFSLFSFSTHPPLKQRILRIQPGWDGRYIFDERKPKRGSDDAVQHEDEDRRKKNIAASVAAGVGLGQNIDVSINQALNSLDNIGEVSREQVRAAQLWHRQMPQQLISNAENPYGAQALMLALLIDEDAMIQREQYAVLDDLIGELHTSNVKQVQSTVAELAGTQTLPLIDLALPTLREMTAEQYQRFKQCIQQLVSADKKVDLREWIIQRVVLQHLDEQYGHRRKPAAKYFVLGSAKQASELMLSLLAYLEHKDPLQAQQAFDTAKRSIGAGALAMLPKDAISLHSLNDAMDELEFLKPPIKKHFLQACVVCISYDGEVAIKAYELTRAIASCLDCPMPPVFVDA
ncbi:MAG: M48 family metallopeptidase [Gammaproteobacteria bacterium]|nr:M48 family metallopeptidase [Gammaproteobacteria bacterium]MBT8133282.1 M48 family metallopeptidase [Gammaproteobacteria bacterium]NNJ49635.1 M48 family metallopeptidase [Gammaproteobacteria bacterium]